MVTEIKWLISLANGANGHERNTRVGKVGWKEISTVNCARDLNSTILPNEICSN